MVINTDTRRGALRSHSFFRSSPITRTLTHPQRWLSFLPNIPMQAPLTERCSDFYFTSSPRPFLNLHAPWFPLKNLPIYITHALADGFVMKFRDIKTSPRLLLISGKLKGVESSLTNRSLGPQGKRVCRAHGGFATETRARCPRRWLS